MRLIHTSDWHLGRKLKGADRTPEIAAALDEMLLKAKELDVDAVLVAGDIFDTPSPPPEAEQAAYNFFCRLKEAKIPAVIIAGNHDSALRIDGAANLLAYAGVQALGRPRKANLGGTIKLDTPGGKLCVAAMPFASERRLLRAEDLWSKDELEQRQYYKQLVSYLLSNLASAFTDSSANVILAHLTVEGAKRTYTEVDMYTRDTYIMAGQMLPVEAQYIALGHIHKPQQVPNAAPTYYSGSLIQIDFGEAGDEKGFNLVDIEPGRPAKAEFIRLTCQKPLVAIECSEIDLEDKLEAYREHPGYLKVIVDAIAPKVGLADKVRKICPQALIVEPRYPKPEATAAELSSETNQFDAAAEFKRYWRDRLGAEAPAAVLQAFENLYQELSDATA